MSQQYTNSISHNTIKRQLACGLLEIYETQSQENPDKKLLLFAEIEASDKDNEDIIEELKNELEYQFFNMPAENEEYAFEASLAKANVRVKDILLSKPKNWLNKIHISAIAVCGEEIHIAPVGNSHAFLVHNQKISDVLKSPQPDNTTNPVKLFTNIVSGNLKNGDSVVIVNESVLDYISEERIRKCAHENPTDNAISKITELLMRAPENKQFGVLVIKRQAQKYAETRNEQIKKTPKNQPQNDFEVENNEMVPNFASYKSKLNSKTIFKKILTKLKPYAQSFTTILLAVILNILEKLQKFFSNLPGAIQKGYILLRTSWKNRNAREYYFSKTDQFFKGKFKKITSIRNGKRAGLGLAIFLITAILITSITIKAKINQEKQEKINIEKKIEVIKNKINEAEAALIYDNKAGARALLSESEQLLSEFSNKYPEQDSAAYEELKSKIAELKNKSEKKRVIENLKPFVNIIPEPIRAKETGIINVKGDIIYFDGISEKIASIDQEQGLMLPVLFNPSQMETFTAAVALSKNTIAAIKNGVVLIMRTDEETITKQQFSYNPESANPFASYSENLYTFDSENNQIIRYRKAGKRFTSAQNWLKQEYDFTTMQDIAVDGFIYLINSQGNIHVFLRGNLSKRIPWPLSDTPSKGVKIYTNENIDSFYVLDSKNKRIVIINKQGKLVEQIEFTDFENASDLTVDDEEEYLYVLSYDKIYQVPLSK